MLGDTALKTKIFDWSLELEVLGLHVSYDYHGMRVRVADKKTEDQAAAIRDALEAGRLPPDSASKLAWRPGFAAQHTFRRASLDMNDMNGRTYFDPTCPGHRWPR